jgi:decaprenylphospho-beta-D-ribofuranose 2-oxidase
MRTLKSQISGWGRYPTQSCNLLRPEKYVDLRAHTESCIARGQGRSYGDASLNQDHVVILTERLNRFIKFDTKSGIITAEAGISLKEILAVITPHHWFLPVTPGTQFVSLGGCVAADIHGKNHHKVGSFGEHIINFVLILADGSHITCSPHENSDIFWATVGGMGLTGIIGEVTLQLIPIKNQYMAVQHQAIKNLEHMCHSFNQSRYDDDYTVTWLDTEREQGIVMAAHASDVPGKHFKAKSKKLNFNMPHFIFNNYSIKLFNYIYFENQSRKTNFISPYQTYFYPLDSITDWNKLYGKKGFVQYQFLLPSVSALKGIQEVLSIMKKNNAVSFLSVLKKLGKASHGLLSFPMEGLTLAMDIKFDGSKTLDLLREFDAVVLAHQGRIYLAKDACLSPENFRAMYPQYEKFMKIKAKIDPHNVFSSSLSRRLKIGS